MENMDNIRVFLSVFIISHLYDGELYDEITEATPSIISRLCDG
jgi:hypothetical protein